MNAALDPAVSRFTARRAENEEEAELWRGKVLAFRNLYAFLSQIIPYQDSDLERLYVFLRYLAAKVPRRKGGPAYQFDDDVRLEYYRLQKISEGSISLSKEYAHPLDGPTEVGSGFAAREPVQLSLLIDLINERFGTDFNQAELLLCCSIECSCLSRRLRVDRERAGGAAHGLISAIHGVRGNQRTCVGQRNGATCRDLE